jgi:cyclopropane fatty-acyl-phospholipid synthase-like methyltransferase
MSDGTPGDFEARYQAGTTPWDIGRPQGALVRAAEAGLVVGSVLDVGCGTGENGLYLAGRGHVVMGLDASPTAIQRAREKQAARGLTPAQAQFHVWDALQLGRLRKAFDTVIDCGLFHLFDRPTRRRYAQSLVEVMSSGSDLLLLCFSDEEPAGPGPFRLREDEIRDAARSLFATMEIQPAELERVEGPPARAWFARLTKI